MSHFRDDSSAIAQDYSTWFRAYAMFIEKRLKCYEVLKYDVETEGLRTKDLDTIDLLEQLPALQQLLYRVLDCQPEGAAVDNHVIQIALSMVALESMKIYSAISDGTINLVDKMQRDDALKALDIYRRAGQQAVRLSEFYEVCKKIDVCRGERFIKIEQPPASFLRAMEEYLMDEPRGSTCLKEQVVDEKSVVVLEIEDNDITDEKEQQPPSPTPEPFKEPPVAELPDLLSWDEPHPVGPDLDEKNVLALDVVPIGDVSYTATASAHNFQNDATGWEMALVTAASFNEGATATMKPAGGLNKLTLDSLYDDVTRRNNNRPASYNPWEPALVTTSQSTQVHDPFLTSKAVAAMTNQQQAFLPQQQVMMSPEYQLPSTNPFGNPYPVNPYGPGMPVQAYNQYAGMI